MIAENKTFTKDLILSLIKDDLTNAKLIHAFLDIGIDANDYTLHLSDTIFGLMGFDDLVQNEPVFDHYYQMSRRVKYLARTSDHFDALADEIYNYLDTVKPKAVSLG